MITAAVHVVEYAPYSHRNERCAVGLLVRTPRGWQGRPAANLRKVRALDPSCDVEALRDALSSVAADLNDHPESMPLYQAGVNGLQVSSGAGRIDYRDDDEFERGVHWALAAAAEPMRAVQQRVREPVSRLFVSVKQVFDSYHWLAAPQQTLEDRRIVVRYPLARDEGVMVDFALADDGLHCLQTIDWRTNAGQRRTEANAKLLTLGMAGALTHKHTLCYAVLAGVNAEEARPAMRLAERVCTDIFVHESAQDMDRLFNVLAKAMGEQPLAALSTGS